MEELCEKRTRPLFYCHAIVIGHDDAANCVCRASFKLSCPVRRPFNYMSVCD